MCSVFVIGIAFFTGILNAAHMKKYTMTPPVRITSTGARSPMSSMPDARIMGIPIVKKMNPRMNSTGDVVDVIRILLYGNANNNSGWWCSGQCFIIVCSKRVVWK